MTVSEDGRPRRPRFSADEEQRAALGDEAWALQDRGKGLRTIQRMFNERGIPISHATVAELISEAQDRAKFLDYVGPAQSRAASIGRLGAALERQIETITQHAAALETGEVPDYLQGATVLDKAMARYVQLETLWVKVTGAAMPVRNQLELTTPEPARPNAQLLEELRKVTQHEQAMEEMEATDGLMD